MSFVFCGLNIDKILKSKFLIILIKKSNILRGFLECFLEYCFFKRNYIYIFFKLSEFDIFDIFEIEDEVKFLIIVDRCINIENLFYIEFVREMFIYLNFLYIWIKINCMNLYYIVENDKIWY